LARFSEGRARFNPRFYRSPVRLAERDEEVLAVLEVPVDRSRGHTSAPRDRCEGGACVALFPNDGSSRFEQRGSCAIALVAFGSTTQGLRVFAYPPLSPNPLIPTSEREFHIPVQPGSQHLFLFLIYKIVLKWLQKRDNDESNNILTMIVFYSPSLMVCKKESLGGDSRYNFLNLDL